MKNSIVAFKGASWKFLGGMPSGIKTTNDVESLVNAAMTRSMIMKLLTVFHGDNFKLRLLCTMGDDVILVYDSPSHHKQLTLDDIA